MSVVDPSGSTTPLREIRGPGCPFAVGCADIDGWLIVSLRLVRCLFEASRVGELVPDRLLRATLS